MNFMKADFNLQPCQSIVLETVVAAFHFFCKFRTSASTMKDKFFPVFYSFLSILFLHHHHELNFLLPINIFKTPMWANGKSYV